MSTLELNLHHVAERTAESLAIADVTRAGTGDWPGRPSITILMQGCPWTCTYCYRPDLQDSAVEGGVEWRQVREQLHLHRGMVDSVVFSGGEPTRQAGLIAAIREVKAMGFRVGLHTAGAYPGRLAAVLPEVDWVGLDIKAAPERYPAVTGALPSGFRAWTSLELVQHSGVDYEVRLTVDPTVHTREDVFDTVREIISRGAHAPVLQQARPGGAAPGYAAELGRRGLYDVIRHDDLPDLERR